MGGLASLITKGTLLVLFEKPAFGRLAQTEFLTVTTSIWIMVRAIVAIGLLLARTTGRYRILGGDGAVWRLS